MCLTQGHPISQWMIQDKNPGLLLSVQCSQLRRFNQTSLKPLGRISASANVVLPLRGFLSDTFSLPNMAYLLSKYLTGPTSSRKPSLTVSTHMVSPQC